VTAASGGEFLRLSALIARQRRELDRIQADAAARSVVDLARGVLMERLGCSPAGAQAQLTSLSQESGASVTELAAQITGQLLPESATPATPATAATAAAAATGAATAAEPADATPSPDTSAPAVALAGAAAELAHDGDSIAAAVLEEALMPAGAVAVALWLAGPDGGLELAGEAGFGSREASRWRRIHPDMDTAAQRAANGGRESWWPAGCPEGENRPLMGPWRQGARPRPPAWPAPPSAWPT
jgi:hypothetical protein